MKIESLLVSQDKSQMQAKYEEIYKDASVWLYKKFDGVHSIILSQIKKYLKDAQVLDVGCGAGRLAIMCAKFAKHVDAFDFSQKAISIAQQIADLTHTENVDFFVGGINELAIMNKRYDLITMSEVIEHLNAPVSSLKHINRLLKKGGILILSCPNFVNFRGYIYMTLLKLLDLPMSLADLRQISHIDIEKWGREAGFRIEKCIGALYKFGWDDKGVTDMIERVPLAIRDKELKTKCHYKSFYSWMKSQVKDNRSYLHYLRESRVLRKIRRQVRISFLDEIDIEDPILKQMKDYLNENITTDPYYSDKEPFNYQGGDTIYVLEKK